jgi:hypothetical protein
MSSTIRVGIWPTTTYHGISVGGRGVFTHEVAAHEAARHSLRVIIHDNSLARKTYAGQHRDGYACGLAVLTAFDGTKAYAEFSPDGNNDGRHLCRDVYRATYYRLFERGESKNKATVWPNCRHCKYNDETCEPDDPRLLVLIAQVAPVEVRPASPSHPPGIAPPLATKQSSDKSAGSVCPAAGAGDRRGHRGVAARRTPSLVAV